MKTDIPDRPFFYAQPARLEKERPEEEGPDVIWTLTALPGNFSACGQTLEEAEANFRKMLTDLVQRVESEGFDLKEWYDGEFEAMTDDERRKWRRDIGALPPPRIRFAGDIPYMKSKQTKRLVRRAA